MPKITQAAAYQELETLVLGSIPTLRILTPPRRSSYRGAWVLSFEIRYGEPLHEALTLMRANAREKAVSGMVDFFLEPTEQKDRAKLYVMRWPD